MKKLGVLLTILALVSTLFSVPSFAETSNHVEMPKQRIYSDLTEFEKAVKQAEEYYKAKDLFNKRSQKEDVTRIKEITSQASKAAAKSKAASKTRNKANSDQNIYNEYILSNAEDAIIYDPNFNESKGKKAVRSVNSDVAVYRPTVTVYTSTMRSSVNGHFSWTYTTHILDGGSQTGNVGGYDAVALSFSNVDSKSLGGILSWGLFTYNRKGEEKFVSYSASGTPSSGSSWGVVFEGQDKIEYNSNNALDYTWDSGDINVVFDSNFYPLSGVVNTTYAHTWKTTEITGYSLNAGNPPSVTFNFSKVDYKWQKTGLYSSY